MLGPTNTPIVIRAQQESEEACGLILEATLLGS